MDCPPARMRLRRPRTAIFGWARRAAFIVSTVCVSSAWPPGGCSRTISPDCWRRRRATCGSVIWEVSPGCTARRSRTFRRMPAARPATSPGSRRRRMAAAFGPEPMPALGDSTDGPGARFPAIGVRIGSMTGLCGRSKRRATAPRGARTAKPSTIAGPARHASLKRTATPAASSGLRGATTDGCGPRIRASAAACMRCPTSPASTTRPYRVPTMARGFRSASSAGS